MPQTKLVPVKPTGPEMVGIPIGGGLYVYTRSTRTTRNYLEEKEVKHGK